MSSVNENISQNKIDIVTNVENNVTVNQPTTSVVTVTTQGPRGAVGPAGPQGEPGAAADVSALNTFTGSAQTNLNALNEFTSSVVLTSQTSSMSVATASYALFAVSASVEITKEVSSSFADTASYVNTLNQNVIITGSLIASGISYPTIDGSNGQTLITDGAGNLSFGLPEKLHLQVRNDDSVDITAGTPIYSTGEIGGSERIKVRIAKASDSSKMPAIGIVETTLTTTGDTKDGFAIINGIYNTNITPVTGTPALGDNIYIHANGGVTTIKPSGSNLIQNIGTVLKTNGTIIQGMKVSSIDRTNDVPNLLKSHIFFGSGSDQQYQLHISGALDQTLINHISASGNISASGYVKALTGSFGRLEGLSPITVGDSITFDQPVTGSVFSGSFIGDGTSLTGVDAFPHTGDAQITGSLLISGSKIHLRGESASPGPILELESIGGSSGKDVYVKVGDASENYAYILGADDTGNSFRIAYGAYDSVAFGSTDRFIIKNTGNIEIPDGDIHLLAGDISGSAASTASFGTYIGDGSNLTGITSAAPGTLSGSAQIATEISGAFTEASGGFSTRVTTLESAGASGIFTDSNGFKQTINNLIISQSNTTASLSVIGSGSAIFNVEGSAGQLFEVQDGLDGVLMSVNDISGIPILTVSSSGNVIIPAGSTFFGTASHALNVPGATSAFPFTGDARIDGTLDVTGSGDNIFKVRSKSGSLFSVDDGLDGILMSVNDISGLPLFEISSSGDVEIVVGNISGSGASTASFGTYIGDGSQLTNLPAGATPTLAEVVTAGASATGDVSITGSLTISGSFNAFRLSTTDVILGEEAGALVNINGRRNVFVGYQAGYSNTIGDDNVAVGYQAGYGLHNNASDANVFIGKLAGGGGTSGAARMSDANSNIGIGSQALLYLNTGDSNIAIGNTAMRGSGATMSAIQNIAIGVAALYKTDSGDNNIGIGYHAGLDQTTGDGNITIGSGSLGIAGESNQLRIGHADIIAISASLETGNIHFKSTNAESLSIFRQEGSAAPGTGATQSIAVTVVSTGDGNKYALDGVITGSIVMNQGDAYKFDQSDSSNSTHPFRFSTDTAGSSNYDVGVVIEGTPGSAGAYTQISVTSATTAPLYYYCSNHADMGLGGILSVDSGSLVSTGVVNITGSLIVSSSNVDFLQATGVSGSFSGSFAGDGNGLTNISSTSLNGISLGLSSIVGDAASSAANYGTVFGKTATSTGGQNVAVGAFSNVKTYGVSIGHSTAGGNNTVAIGYNAGNTSGENNVLVGYQPGVNTSGDYNISLGYLAGYDQTSGTGNITIGSGSRGIAGESNQLRIGHGLHGALISGSLSDGGIMIQGQVSASSYIGDGSGLTGISTTPFPFTGDARITGSLEVSGSGFKVDTSLGTALQVKQDGTIVLGANTSGATQQGLPIGYGATIYGGVRGVAVGYQSSAATNSVTVGANASAASAGSAVVVGGYASATADKTVAIGYDADVSGVHSIAIGSYINASGTNSITLNSSTYPNTVNSSTNNSFEVYMTSNSIPDFQVTNTHITASGDISSSGTITAAEITVQGSGSTLFEVIGSEGTIFALDDDLDGTLFTVNDRSGIPQFEVSASGLVEIGNGPLIANTYETGSIANGSPSSPLQMTMPSGSSKQLFGVGGTYRARVSQGADTIFYHDDYIKVQFNDTTIDQIEGEILIDPQGDSSSEVLVTVNNEGSYSHTDQQVSDGMSDWFTSLGNNEMVIITLTAPQDITWPMYRMTIVTGTSSANAGCNILVEKFI